MKKPTLAVLVVFMLSGCASSQIRIHWVKVADKEEASQYCNFVRGKFVDFHAVLGCKYMSGSTCVVVAPDCEPRDLKCFGVLGHEVKHCFEGSYHE